MTRIRNLILVIFHIWISVVTSIYAFSCNDLKMMCILTLLQLIYTIAVFVALRVSPLDFGAVFIICLMLFNYGQTWLYAINVDNTDLQGYVNVFNTFSDEVILIALRYALVTVFISLLIFICTTSKAVRFPVLQDSNPERNVLPISWRNWQFIYAIYWSVVLLSNIVRAVNVSAIGYVSGFTFDNEFLYTINLYIIPMVIVDMRYRKFRNCGYVGAILPLLINEAIVILFVGNRGASLIRLIVITVYYFNQKDRNRIKKSTFIGVGCMALVISFVLPFISATRTDLLEVNFWTFITKNNPIVIFLSEFGGTLSTSCYAISAVRSGDGSNGLQMLSCILTILPGSGFFFPNVVSDLQFSSRLNRLFHIRGLGGSLTGEFYYNFRFFGVFLYGIIYMLLMKLTRRALDRDNNIYREVFIYEAMFGMLTWIRGSLYDVANAMKIAIYFCAIIWILSTIGRKRAAG